MRPKKKKIFSRKRRRRLPYLSILTGAFGGAFLTVGLIGMEPNATGMPIRVVNLAPVPSRTEVVLRPQFAVEESNGDQAAGALAPTPKVRLAAVGSRRVPAQPRPQHKPATVAAPPPPAAGGGETLVRTVAIGRGDTLMKVMVKAGAGRRQAQAAIRALSRHHDPRRLRPGQEITMTFTTGTDEARQLLDVSLDADVDKSIVARRAGDGGFRAEVIDRPLVRQATATAGKIDLSLYAAAEAAKVPPQIIVDLIRLYSFDIDFQRDIQPGDRFQLLYDVLQDENGTVVKHGEILFAQLTVGGKALPLYRFKLPDGDVGYFNARGESVKKALMKTPVDGARLSSRYGRRRHPILGYTKMHRGLDFAAPRGTPVMAAGDGKVESAGWNGSYGRYVRLRHNSEFKTAYAHMTRFAKGVKRGKRVKQGQVIGYVGSTGRSTGPHLHYEILRGGRQINPLGLKLPTGRKLSGSERRHFQKARAALDVRYAALATPEQVAQGD